MFSRCSCIFGRRLTAFAAAAALLSLLPQAQAADFVVSESDLAKPLSVVAYGDMRFTDPANTSATNPVVRKWLVDKIASEHPAALLLSGDVPWHGAEKNDYAVFRRESQAWRNARIRIYPALGNHELNGDPQECIQNWWTAFPELRPRRWYSVQLGERFYLLNLDSNSALLPGSDQDRWIRHELSSLPQSVQFVFVNLHHPPVSDFQEHGDASHNVRPNEKALADTLKKLQPGSRAQLIVTAGHVHNYERFLQDGIVYLVSGGGGATPRPVIRTAQDLYSSSQFPNYHYVKFVLDGSVLHAAMIRIANPSGGRPGWEQSDRFEIPRR
jgi:acid phosphatase type 7